MSSSPQRPVPAHPPVSVIMPLLNEEHHLREAVGSVLAQDYPGELQVVLAVGPSRDRTRAVADQVSAEDPRVVVVDNPSGRTPDGLNAAIAASSHDIVVRMDGHGALSDGYIRRAVEVLEETGAANVGGVMLAEGTSDLQQAVAVAMRSPLGIGAARFHVGGEAGPVDTVYLGVFRREWLERVGGYDTEFTRAQDWEMNHRIREAGGTVWFTPELTVTYRPRATFRDLARQFYTTGQWRRHVARTHPGTLNLRYLAPPVATAAVVAGAVGGLLWRPLWVLPLGYAAAVTVGGAWTARGERPGVVVRMPAVLATMHLTWGAGFLRGTRRR
ncbi:glycosyl transferase family 2 [Ornithinimicrobium humiphilum]|uniref:Glycosyl transferase family 2 n=1 Tax=Ornithinimicrobium humiphilum TaxID=125288 RepID=A0A543KMC3_9MICO|nr:glycosyltransferase family 2 protein [Ornithinimicrobium humiphilum]TQM96230.1 glycosyl transferase family 2 [Ornithinimicrobium humiphilum]